ncbi:MAG TPA: alpha-glucosidase C-terminal domain-containing protein, partial [Anaerolineae bacterium]
PALLTYKRQIGNQTLLIVNNLTGSPQTLALRPEQQAIDVLSQRQFPPQHSFTLAPFEFLWLELKAVSE